MKKILNQVLLIGSFICLSSCASKKTLIAPLNNIYFKSDNWLMLYTESTEPDGYLDFSTRNDWILTDNKIIDSLKSEFKCAVSKQSDCMNCFIMNLYKNQKHFTEFMFENKNHISLGTFKKHMTPVSKFEIKCKNVEVAKSTIDSLNRLSIPNICLPDIDQPFQYTYTINLSFRNVNDTSFSTSKQKRIWQNSFAWLAQQELLRLYPDINSNNFAVYCAGMYYKALIHCHKDFFLDIAKLKNNRTIRFYDIVGLEEKKYILTYFSKR